MLIDGVSYARASEQKERQKRGDVLNQMTSSGHADVA